MPSPVMLSTIIDQSGDRDYPDNGVTQTKRTPDDGSGSTEKREYSAG
jgi:hypothetical protein